VNLWLTAESETNTERLHFVADVDGGFSLDTGLLRGRLRAGGQSLGLTRVQHVPTGLRIDRSQGWLSHYCVFTPGIRYGAGAWDWPSTAALRPDGSVTVNWPVAEARPFGLQAHYKWVSGRAIEVQTTVHAARDVQGFETFLASYLDVGFTNAFVRVLAQENASPTWIRLEPRLGDWLMFPRDADARRLSEDGRWTLEPHPVAWVLPAGFATPQPAAARQARAAGLSVELAATDDGCFAVASPHELEGHYSTYFSLFGRDFRAGESARATVRLSLVRGCDPMGHP
jgi:hypothetical protein